MNDDGKEVAAVTAHGSSNEAVRTVRRWLSPTCFAVAAVAFFLPFATVSCDDASTTFTGVQLVTHTVPHGGVVNEPPDCSADIGACVENQSSATATIGLLAALAGVGLGLFGIARGPGWCALLGFGAIAALPFETEMADVSLHSGYLLSVASFLAAGLLHLARAVGRGRRAKAPPGACGGQIAPS